MIVLEENHRSLEQFGHELMIHEIDQHFRFRTGIVERQWNGEPEHSFDDQMVICHVRSNAFAENIEQILAWIQ